MYAEPKADFGSVIIACIFLIIGWKKISERVRSTAQGSDQELAVELKMP